VAREILVSDEISLMMREGISVFSRDQTFVAGELAKLGTVGLDGDNRFVGQIVTDSFGVMGHSMGGMASDRSCINETVFYACISLDGALYSQINVGTHPAKSRKPFLLLQSEQFIFFIEPGSPEYIAAQAGFAKRFLETWQDVTVFMAKGSRHNSYNDLPFVAGFDYADESLQTQQATFDIVAAFFRGARSGNHVSQALDAAANYPRFELLSLEALLAAAPVDTSEE